MKRNKTRSINIQRNAFMRGVLLIANGRKSELRIGNDHDTQWQTILVPFGILNTHSNQLSIYFGHSAETSDFIVDCLTAWWNENQHDYHNLDELLIDLA